MMATGTATAVLRDFKTRVSAIATALVSRDGVVLYADVPTGSFVDTFAIMCATVLGAATAANLELRKAPPEFVAIEANDSTTLIAGCGSKALLVAMVDPTGDRAMVLREVAKFAELLKVN